MLAPLLAAATSGADTPPGPFLVPLLVAIALAMGALALEDPIRGSPPARAAAQMALAGAGVAVAIATWLASEAGSGGSWSWIGLDLLAWVMLVVAATRVTLRPRRA